MKKVSIITPIYNCKDFIGRCAEYVINQTYSNIEWILVDDGSTDDSYQLIKNLEKSNSNIIKVFHQKNSGQAIARNNGINYSTGEYITFLDDDDFFDLDYIEKLVTEIEKNDILLSGYNRVNDEKIVKKNIPYVDEWSLYKFGASWGKLYKKSFLIKNNLSFGKYTAGEDIYLFMNSIALTKKIKIISYAGYNNYINSISVTHTMYSDKKKLHEMLPIMKAIEESGFVSKLNQDYLLYFYLKSICLQLFNCRFVLNIDEQKEKYDEYISWVESCYKKRKKSIKIKNPKHEELNVKIIVTLLLIAKKTKTINLFLLIISKLGKNTMR